MKILLDANIIMDALQERQPFDAPAKEILRRGQSGGLDIGFTANAATDIFYLYTKARSLSSARSAVAFLLNAFRIVSVTHEDCLAAMRLPIADFEDALVSVCAKKDGADYIVTRDEKFLNSESAVPLIQARDLLNEL